MRRPKYYWFNTASIGYMSIYLPMPLYTRRIPSINDSHTTQRTHTHPQKNVRKREANDAQFEHWYIVTLHYIIFGYENIYISNRSLSLSFFHSMSPALFSAYSFRFGTYIYCSTRRFFTFSSSHLIFRLVCVRERMPMCDEDFDIFSIFCQLRKGTECV